VTPPGTNPPNAAQPPNGTAPGQAQPGAAPAPEKKKGLLDKIFGIFGSKNDKKPAPGPTKPNG